MNVNKSTLWCCVVVMCGLLGCKPGPDKTAEEKPIGRTVSVKADQIQLRPLDGSAPVPLAKAGASETFILVFFAPWVDSGAGVEQWISENKLAGTDVIPVVVDQRPPGERTASASLASLERTVYLADDRLIDLVGGVRALPTAVLIKGGSVQSKWIGLPSFTGLVASVHSSFATTP